MTFIIPFDIDDKPILRRRNEDQYDYAVRVALTNLERRRLPISRADVRAHHRARIEAELAERTARCDTELETVVRKRIRNTAGNSKKADKKRRSEAWWLKVEYTFGYKTFTFEYLQRQICGHLTPAEQVVVLFIFGRTVWWLKKWETIRLSQFISGSRPRPDGSRLFWGTGLSERTIRNTLKKLVDDGLVLRKDKAGGSGLQEFALPRVDEFQRLPRFASVNITFTAPFHVDGKEWQEITL